MVHQVDNLSLQLISYLNDVEIYLKELGLWSDTEPSVEALSSTEPFAVDTLEFVEWLQFILIPRLQSLVEMAALLPGNCGIAPMAETYFCGSCHDAGKLINVLSDIDSLLSESV
jgi:uncharacterized protein YqcC (DUF446 family)